MSKGSRRRPMSVSPEQFAENWDEAFGTRDYISDMAESIHKLEAIMPQEHTNRIRHKLQRILPKIIRTFKEMDQDYVQSQTEKQS